GGGRGIAANPTEAELREGEHASEPVDEVKRGGSGREHAGRHRNADDIVGTCQIREGAEQDCGGDDASDLHPMRMAPRLMSPSGRRNRMAIIARNTTVSCHTISKKPPTQLSIRPRPTEAATTPATLPRPPMMMSAKALKMRGWPIIGDTSWIGANAAPAIPHSALARMTVLRATALGCTPTMSAASRFCATARMTRPNCVCRTIR